MSSIFAGLILLASLMTPLAAQESICQRRSLTAEDWAALTQTQSKLTREEFDKLSAEEKEWVCSSRAHLAAVRRTGRWDSSFRARFRARYLREQAAPSERVSEWTQVKEAFDEELAREARRITR